MSLTACISAPVFFGRYSDVYPAEGETKVFGVLT